jgi:hypothetical protein
VSSLGSFGKSCMAEAPLENARDRSLHPARMVAHGCSRSAPPEASQPCRHMSSLTSLHEITCCSGRESKLRIRQSQSPE